MEVKCMRTHTPGDCAVLRGRRTLIRLALNTHVHDVVAADCTIINFYIPSPQGYGVPFLDFESFLRFGHVHRGE